jgi:hypothetical protein
VEPAIKGRHAYNDRVKTILPACVVLLALVGCRLPKEMDDGGDAGGRDGNADLGNATGSDVQIEVGGGGGPGLVCTNNDIVNTAPVVAYFAVFGEPPAAGGGTLVDGRYHLTEALVYTGITGLIGPTGATVSDTIVISFATTGTALVHEVTDGPTETRQTFTMQPTGTTLDVRPGCPRGTAAQASLFPYTVDDVSLSIQRDATTVIRYARQ